MKRSTTWATLAGLAALPVLGALGAPGGPRGTLDGRRETLERAEARLLALVAEARRDPRTALVERYLSWTRVEDFQNSRREVRVTDLVKFMTDEDAPMDLRARARDALRSITQRSLDPDLSIEEGRNKRAAFSRDKLVPLLTKGGEKGLATRGFAAEILESYWHFPEPDIQRYDAGDEATWRKAADAYLKRLRGK